jgi:hypothetical protein
MGDATSVRTSAQTDAKPLRESLRVGPFVALLVAASVGFVAVLFGLEHLGDVAVLLLLGIIAVAAAFSILRSS